MNDTNDPTYIVNLLRPEVNHNCYFVVGDPSLGPVERIGVVSAMLMAHSMVLRRALSVQDTEHNERWDITLTDVQPHVFKSVLKFTYGYNNIGSYSIEEALEMLKVADRLIMLPLANEATKRIVDLLTPATVPLALSDPVALNISPLENNIMKMVQDNMKAVLESENLQHMCPAGMKYIVRLNADERVSHAALWRGVMKWARAKVLKQHLPSGASRLEKYARPRLVAPSKEHSLVCCLTAIQLAEEVIMGSSDSAAFLSHYHFVQTGPPQRLFVCTGFTKDNHTLRHEEVDVIVIQDCSVWTDPVLKTSSDLYMNTGNVSVELHSIVCSTRRKCEAEELVHKFEKCSVMQECKQEELDDEFEECFTRQDCEEEGSSHDLKKEDHLARYQCSGSVCIFCVSSEEETSVANIEIMEEVTFDEELEILIRSNCAKVKLLPHSKYKIQVNFSKPHPLWYSSEVQYSFPKSCTDLNVQCGVVNEVKFWYGSHVKYIMFRTGSKED